MFTSNKGRDARRFEPSRKTIIGLASTNNIDGSCNIVDASILHDNSCYRAEDFSIQCILEGGNVDLLKPTGTISPTPLDGSDIVNSLVENSNFVETQFSK